jgi:hypothetical protein
MVPVIRVPKNVRVFQSNQYRTFFTTRKINSISLIVKPLHEASLEPDLAISDPWLGQAEAGGGESTNHALNSLLSRLAIHKSTRLHIIEGTANIKEAEAKLMELRRETEVTLRAYLFKYSYL